MSLSFFKSKYSVAVGSGDLEDRGLNMLTHCGQNLFHSLGH